MRVHDSARKHGVDPASASRTESIARASNLWDGLRAKGYTDEDMGQLRVNGQATDCR